ncbi:hypothetical protein EG68_04154 [Paragonimus skrjabini miyazakii]|uniref:MMS19 nucleotide excision repair protein n=1 Tax=Paragonimus skrjabini miyazakii TaxID=59628 RepID=A0A8S9YZH5_9TREM|nr:hypothetical protein EG68_04154 [Paragonimus skrjabini miyazakii]
MVTLLNLVESLETGLVDDKLTSQRDSLKSLVSRLKLLSIDLVQELEVDHLVTFFTSRLAIADPEVLSHLLDGFLWVVQAVRTDGRDLVTPTQAVYICHRGLFANLVVQSLTKSARLRVFKILHTMLHGHQVSGLQSMGSEFVSAYVQAIDGEKDPENLILIFQMNLIVMQHFPIDHVKEDFFEVMSVYFPVDFSPPPDVIGARITRSSLADGLHHCLFMSRTFSGPYLLPLLCEKAESDLIQAQFDSLALLADCLHGCLHSVTKATSNNIIDFRGPSIPFHHLSSYLVLVAPMLANLINKTKSRKVLSLTTACLTGLVHSYATQVNDVHHLKDFAVVLLKAFGVHLDGNSLVEWKDNDVHSPVSLPVRTVGALLEVVRSSRPHQLLCGILIDYLVPYFGAPLLTWSQTETLALLTYLKQLQPWLPSLMIACRVLDAVTVSSVDTGTPKSVDSEMKLDSLNNLHCNLSNLLLELHRTITVETHASDFPDPETSSIRLAIVLTGLSIRLYSVRRQLANTLDVDSLFLTAETLGHLVGLWEKLGLTLSDDSDMSVSEDLGVVVSRLYSMNCFRVVNKLNEMLFAPIEATIRSGSGCCLVLDLLRHAACVDARVLDRLVVFLLDRIDGETEEFRPLIYKKTVQVLYAIAQYGIQSPTESENSMFHLCELFVRRPLSICPPSYHKHPVEHLDSIFRIVTSRCPSNQQLQLLNTFRELHDQSSSEGLMMPLVLWCSILTGVCPDAVRILNSEKLLDQLMCDAMDWLQHNSIPDTLNLLKHIVLAYASVLNKCPEPLDTAVSMCISNSLNRLLTQALSTEHFLKFVASWLAMCLHSLIAHPGPSRLALINQLLSTVLIGPIEMCASQSQHFEIVATPILTMVVIRLLDCLPELCNPILPGQPASEFCHWQTTSVYKQKVYQLVASPLATQVDVLHRLVSIAEVNRKSMEDLRDAYLTAFLRLCVLLPTELLTTNLKDLVRHSMLAVTSSSDFVAQSAGLRLFCALTDSLSADVLTNRLSIADADDLFVALPRLEQTARPVDIKHLADGCLSETTRSSAMGTALVRLSIARCLTSMVHLPAEVTGRHRNREVLPILQRLIDDPNRAVRLEAVRAQNAWLLRA